MKIIVQQTLKSSDPAVLIGELVFASTPELGESIGTSAMVLADKSVFDIKAGFSNRTNNLNLAASYRGKPLFVALLRWDTLDPYFQFDLADQGIVHMFFSKG